MCSLRVRAASAPSGATTIAVLNPSPPSPARSYSDACTNTPVSFASPAANANVGPSGMSSRAESQRSGPSGVIAKYGESVSSWRQTIFAPCSAAIRTPSAIAAWCSVGSGCQRCWTAPTRNGARLGASTRAGEAGTPSIAVMSRTSRSLGGRFELRRLELGPLVTPRQPVALDDGDRRRRHRGVELEARLRPQLADRVLAVAGCAVGTGCGHGAERVGRADDARGDRGLLAREPVGIPAAVPALVAGPPDLADVLQRSAHAVQHPLARDRVAAHDIPLVVAQRTGLVDDLLGYADLADVVQQRAELDEPPLVLAEAELVCDRHRQRNDALAVRAGVFVVLADQLAEQQRRAPVRPARLDLLIQPGAALLREHPHQQREREQQDEGVAAVLAGKRGHHADRAQEHVDGPDRRELAHVHLGGAARPSPLARRRDHEV